MLSTTTEESNLNQWINFGRKMQNVEIAQCFTVSQIPITLFQVLREYNFLVKR